MITEPTLTHLISGRNIRLIVPGAGRVRPGMIRAQTDYPIRRGHGGLMYGDDYEDYYPTRRRGLGHRYRDLYDPDPYF